MSNPLSVVTACYNDIEKLETTLASFRGELQAGDELLIIDSSSDWGRVRLLVENSQLSCTYKYCWTPPGGVYQAQNRGILDSSFKWIQIVNAGDCFLPGARLAIDEAIDAFPGASLHVFRQLAIGSDGPAYVFTPTPGSVWPHQSIIVHRSVYDREGNYLEKYRFGADQMYFARVRGSQPWELHPFVLTSYLLGGLSAGISFRHLREVFWVRRALGEGFVRSAVRAFVLPVARKLLENTFGAVFVTRLKSRLYRYYTPVDSHRGH